MASKKGSKKMSTKQVVGIGAIVAATAAAAASAYYLYGSKHAAQNRKKVKGWMLKAKGEVLEQIEKAKTAITQADYERMVEQVMKKYDKLSSTSAAEVASLSKELKGHWKNMQKEAGKAPAKRKKSTKKGSK